MLGSLYSAVSGLSAHQTKMNVIGNNIANINTYGFKSSRVTFTDVFYQTLSTASSSSSESGGTNPTQLGYGAQVNSIDVINTRAGSTTTDRALDVYINGDGYMAVQGSDGAIKYTRVGILSFDSSGNLVDSGGNIVLGLTTNETTGQVELGEDGTTTTSSLTKITVDPDVYASYTDISIGENGEITATEAGDPEVTLSSGTGWVDTATLAKESNFTGDIKMTATVGTTAFAIASPVSASTVSNTADMLDTSVVLANNAGTYTMNYTDGNGVAHSLAGTTAISGTDTIVTFSNVPTLTGTPATTTASFTIPTASLPGTGASYTMGSATAATKNITLSTYLKSGASVNLTGSWSAASDVSGSSPIVWSASTPTGYTTDLTMSVDTDEFAELADLTNKTIGGAGAGDGKTVVIANLAVVKFSNADGLSQDGEGYYIETANSGEAVATVAGNEGTGSLLAGSLESSNVDLSQELTEMIITQRGFQANSKMITVSDEMLDTLVNMKR